MAGKKIDEGMLVVLYKKILRKIVRPVKDTLSDEWKLRESILCNTLMYKPNI